MREMRFVSTCAAGLETLTAEELKAGGAVSVTPQRGSVSWQGSLAQGYWACLWSRVSSRVLLEIAHGSVGEADGVYELAREVPWEEHFSGGSTFAVDCTLGEASPVRHSKFGALRVKDGIVDRFRERTGTRPAVELKRPNIRLHVHIERSRTTLAIDMSGESLHRRGYRAAGGEAPLKENLAAAMVKLSGWSGDRALVDPMCGSATLLIEAAMLYGDTAPGLGRTFFGFLAWHEHDERLWAELVEAAIEREESAQHKPWPELLGFDADGAVIAVARENISRAGLETRIRVEQQTLSSLTCPAPRGHVLSNLPYGLRIGDKDVVKYLYRGLGNQLHKGFAGWATSVFIANPDLIDQIRIAVSKSYRLYNGGVACRLVNGRVGRTESGYDWSIGAYPPQLEGRSFANRLVKNLKKRLNWAKRNNIQCFRIYDRDLPQYNVTIEIYGRWVVVAEHRAAASVDSETARQRLSTVLRIVRALLNVGRDRLYVRRRATGPGGGRGDRREVPEGGHFFTVDLPGYPDTGLCLEQRLIRRRLGQEAQGARVLVLFDPVGAATVHAALGGARTTTTIAWNEDGVQRIRENVALNGLYLPHHTVVAQPVMERLKQSSERYDVIFASFDPSRLHHRSPHRLTGSKHVADCIAATLRRLEPGGLLLMVSPPSFSPSRKLAKQYDWRDISRGYIPADCRTGKAQLRCWEVRLRPE